MIAVTDHDAGVSRTSYPLIVAALLFCACRSGGPPADANPDASVGAGGESPSPAGFVSLELKNEPVDEVLQKLATAAGKPFVIDPDAQAVAHCARITLLTGGNMPAEKALALVREALDTSGFTLVESGTGGIVVRRNPDKPLPATCQGAASTEPSTREPSAVSELNEKFSAGVRRISDTEYEITRAALDLLLENQSTLIRSARVVPYQRDGQTAGMRLFGIRASSPLGTLGFKNGDVVSSIGGHALSSPDKALEAYADLKTAKSFEIMIERRGQTTKMSYRLTDK